uniref:4-alpha-glucanotransferase n=1 Tax=Bordetella pertussis TaxID=520 RepID=UPI003877AF2D
MGLIADLAVGVDPAGSQTWAQPDAMLGGLNVGAAPDLRHPGGQDWRLTACSPATLATQGYAAYIDMLRRALASAGGVRIDHVLGLARLWVIPEGASPDQGAYLAFPVEDLLRLAALEAWRHRAVLIGENLGQRRRHDQHARLAYPARLVAGARSGLVRACARGRRAAPAARPGPARPVAPGGP